MYKERLERNRRSVSLLVYMQRLYCLQKRNCCNGECKLPKCYTL